MSICGFNSTKFTFNTSNYFIFQTKRTTVFWGMQETKSDRTEKMLGS